MRFPLRAVAAALALIAAGQPCPAQSPLPDPHWGANAFPQSTPQIRAGLSLNRFTEFSGSGDRFNEIDQSAGFNLFVLSYTDRVPALPEWSVTMHGGLGVSRDEPTESFQNDYVHWILDQVSVPVGDSREETEFIGGLALTRWFEPTVGSDCFVGGGVASGTLYHESYLHVGFQQLFEESRLRLGAMGRIGAPSGGEAFPEVASFGALLQTSAAYVPEGIQSSNAFWNVLGNPQVALTLTWDSGLFEDEGGHAIDIFFASLRIEWATGLMLETWNDIANGSDFGPTFGVMLSLDLSTFFDLGT